jgi:hypothetical protein
VPNKARKWVIAALADIAKVLPFPLLGIDSDYADLWIMPTWAPDRLRGMGSVLRRSA